jgi:hypothetical protein
MRHSALLMIVSLMVLPAEAKRVTVAQLEQILVAAADARKSDTEIVRQIGGLELSERVTATTLDQLGSHLVTGSQAALALQLLADRSAFLDPPPSELPGSPTPSDAAQQLMLEATRQYVAQNITTAPQLVCNTYDEPLR